MIKYCANHISSRSLNNIVLSSWEWEKLIFICSGVNFTNIIRAAFTCSNPESAKRLLDLTVLFVLLWSASGKAARRMLMKLTTDEYRCCVVLFCPRTKKLASLFSPVVVLDRLSSWIKAKSFINATICTAISNSYNLLVFQTVKKHWFSSLSHFKGKILSMRKFWSSLLAHKLLLLKGTSQRHYLFGNVFGRQRLPNL